MYTAFPRKISTRIRRALAIVVGGCLAGLCSPASAADSPTPDFALSVSPTRMVVPADQIGRPQSFQVTDRGRLPLDVGVSAQAFEQGADGAPRFEADAPYSAAHWVAVTPGRFHLAPGGHQTVTVRISAPANPEPGEHQVALISSVAGPATGAAIRVNRGIGVALYITVPGNADTSADVTRLDAPWFAMGGPVGFTVAVHSTGTVHREFSGADRLSLAVPGGQVGIADFLVLRGATRVVAVQWKNPPILCVCQASVSILNSEGRTSRLSRTVIVFPVQWFGLALGALLVLFIVRRLVRRRFRNAVAAKARVLRESGGSE